MTNFVLVTVLAIVPQTFLLFYATLGLVGAKSPPRRLLIPTLILGLVVGLTRSVDALFGWHIPIFLITFLILSQLFRLASVLSALAAVALSFILVVLADILVLTPVLTVMQIPYEDVWSHGWTRIIFGWVESVFLIAAALLVKLKDFVLIPMTKRQDTHEHEGSERSLDAPSNDL